MSQNPYSSPNAAPALGARNRSLICTAMFWLSCVLCVAMFGIAANGGYQYWFYTSRKGITLPARIFAENVCVACSGIVMLYAVITWRRQLPRAGAVLFVCALLMFYFGPVLLRFLF